MCLQFWIETISLRSEFDPYAFPEEYILSETGVMCSEPAPPTDGTVIYMYTGVAQGFCQDAMLFYTSSTEVWKLDKFQVLIILQYRKENLLFPSTSA